MKYFSRPKKIAEGRADEVSALFTQAMIGYGRFIDHDQCSVLMVSLQSSNTWPEFTKRVERYTEILIDGNFKTFDGFISPRLRLTLVSWGKTNKPNQRLEIKCDGVTGESFDASEMGLINPHALPAYKKQYKKQNRLANK